MYPDIYFEPKFGEINKEIEGGEPLHIVVETEDGKIESNVIKREIPTQIAGETYYDLITPYGYGGPVITEQADSSEKLIASYEAYMENFVQKENIVSEFIRFHPIVKNDEGFEDIYEISAIRPVVQTKIHGDDTFQKEFSKSTRKTVRRSLREEGVSYQVTHAPKNIESFKKIYYDTMDRVDASDFYFFDDEYFDALQASFNDNILLIEIFFEDQVVAAGLYFIYDGIMHAHLSGTDSEYLKYSPAYLTKFAAVEWGDAHGAKLLYSGGGTTNAKDDGLYRFKKRFSSTPDLTFKTGKKIWQPQVYQALVEKTCGDMDVSEVDFFPLYRYEQSMD